MAPWKLPVLISLQGQFCVPKAYEKIYKVPKILQEDRFIMSNCCHNEYVGLRNRYLKKMDNNTTYVSEIVERVLDELAGKLKPHYSGPISLESFLNGKKGRLRKRYLDCFDSIDKRGFDLEKDGDCSAFVKNELYSEVKPPRLIINRNPKFGLVYGMFTHALEGAMMQLPQISKGKDFKNRGKQFEQLIYGAWALEGDCSKFEASQRVRLLKHIECGLMRRLEDDVGYKRFLKLFYRKLRKNGFTQNGQKFSFTGMRGSGDADTGLFNTLLMWVACRYFEIINSTGLGNFICDGDDNVIRMPKGKEDYINTFAHFGFDAKLILRKDYHDIDYCSGKFMQYNRVGNFMYVQNIRKIINNMTVFRKLNFNHCKTDYYHSLGYMYKKLYGDLPLFGDFADFLLRSTKGRYVKPEILKELNPVYEDFLKFDVCDVVWDNSCLIEICMLFDMNIGIVEEIKEFYGNAVIEFEPFESKRYRNIGEKLTIPKPVDIRLVESRIWAVLDL
nr:RNA-dependent RNA polymerase [Tolivirales sp.]